MTTIVNMVAEASYILDRDGPGPIAFVRMDGSGVPEARSNSLQCTIVGTTTLTKTVGGGGITLSTHGGVENSLVVLQLTAAEIAGFERGNFTSYEFREGSSDPYNIILQGRIILK